MGKLFLSIIGYIATHWWWPHWSNVRWKKAIHDNIPISDDLKIINIYQIEPVLRKLYNKFKWTSDDFTQLWDCMTPPPQTYQHYLDGLLKDDCDGFHSLVLHVFRNNNIRCYLLAVEARGAGHCVLLCQYEGLWHVVDYTTLYNGFSTPKEAIQDYEKTFVKRYHAKGDVYYSGLINYDYSDGKFKNIFLKDLEEK